MTIIRWIIRRDIDDVLAIDKCVPEELRWDADAYISHLRCQNGHGRVIEVDGSICGVMLFSLFSDHYEINRLIIGLDHRRKGIGTKLVRSLIDRVESTKSLRRSFVSILAPDDQLGTHMFLKSLRFKADPKTLVVRASVGYVDCYRFRFERSSEPCFVFETPTWGNS